MRVAVVTYALEVGGIETYIRFLAGHFASAGHEVAVVETLREGRWSRSFEAAGLRVVRLLPRPHRSRLHHAGRLAAFLRGCDLVVLNDAPAAQSVLGTLPESAVAVPVLHSPLPGMVRNAVSCAGEWDSLAAVSPSLADAAVAAGAPPDRVVCIPNGVEVPATWPRADRQDPTPGRLEVVFVGTVSHEQKGVFDLAGIASRLRSRRVPFRLTVVGEGEDLAELRRRTAGCDDVRFLGRLNNDAALEVVRGSDVLVLPSRFEGLGIVVLEAMAEGAVPVASRLPGCTDLMIEDGVNGVLLPAGDEDAFAASIAALAADPLALQQMSRRAWETAGARFRQTVTGDRYLALAAECAARRRAGLAQRRDGRIATELLGEHPWLPLALERPWRRLGRILPRSSGEGRP